MIEIYLQDKKATTVLSPFLVSATVTENLNKEIDSLEIILDNADLRFSKGWVLPKNAKMEIKENGSSLGVYYIDEVEFSSSKKSKTATVRALAVKFEKKNIRNEYIAEFEDTTFMTVLKDVCNSAGLKIDSNVIDFKIDDIYFSGMTKGAVISQLSQAYNCYVKIKDNTAIIIDKDFNKNDKNYIDDYIETIDYKIVSLSTAPRSPKKATGYDWDNDKGIDFDFGDTTIEDETGNYTVQSYEVWRGGIEKDYVRLNVQTKSAEAQKRILKARNKKRVEGSISLVANIATTGQIFHVKNEGLLKEFNLIVQKKTSSFTKKSTSYNIEFTSK